MKPSQKTSPFDIPTRIVAVDPETGAIIPSPYDDDELTCQTVASGASSEKSNISHDKNQAQYIPSGAQDSPEDDTAVWRPKKGLKPVCIVMKINAFFRGQKRATQIIGATVLLSALLICVAAVAASSQSSFTYPDPIVVEPYHSISTPHNAPPKQQGTAIRTLIAPSPPETPLLPIINGAPTGPKLVDAVEALSTGDLHRAIDLYQKLEAHNPTERSHHMAVDVLSKQIKEPIR